VRGSYALVYLNVDETLSHLEKVVDSENLTVCPPLLCSRYHQNLEILLQLANLLCLLVPRGGDGIAQVLQFVGIIVYVNLEFPAR